MRCVWTFFLFVFPKNEAFVCLNLVCLFLFLIEMVENAVVIAVRVYRPIKNNPRQPVSSFRYVQEILLLGKYVQQKFRVKL